MTEPSGTDFDELVETRAGGSAEPAPAAPHRWMWPAITATLGLLGAGALVAAALTPAGGQPAAESTPTPTTTATAQPTTAPTRTPATISPASPEEATDTPLAELADPDWIERIAASGDIPERALAAYAGAALAVAETDPGCGLGWNTLAAIGLVETEHGSMNGAVLHPDGTVSPAIIGIPLNGDGTNEVSDTDQGRVDGDTTWDRAVGPFQFIPSTWAETAQDGNRDGKTDINQIDDAALAAGLHLCDVGGDLTQAANWIAAIGAYNPSADYNNRVAEAASHYATLR